MRCRRLLTGAALLLGPLAAAADPAAPAASAACAGLAMPRPILRLEVRPSLDPPVDRSLGVLALSTKARALSSAHARFGRVVGLTVARFPVEIVALQVRTVARDGVLCAAPAEVVMTLASIQEVWVVKSAIRAPCWDQAILDHELQHVAFNNEAVQATADRLGTLLTLLAEAPVAVQDARSAPALMAKTIRALIPAASDPAFAAARLKHAGIDTRQAYEKVRIACGL